MPNNVALQIHNTPQVLVLEVSAYADRFRWTTVTARTSRRAVLVATDHIDPAVRVEVREIAPPRPVTPDADSDVIRTIEVHSWTFTLDAIYPPLPTTDFYEPGAVTNEDGDE